MSETLVPPSTPEFQPDKLQSNLKQAVLISIGTLLASFVVSPDIVNPPVAEARPTVRTEKLSLSSLRSRCFNLAESLQKKNASPLVSIACYANLYKQGSVEGNSNINSTIFNNIGWLLGHTQSAKGLGVEILFNVGATGNVNAQNGFKNLGDPFERVNRATYLNQLKLLEAALRDNKDSIIKYLGKSGIPDSGYSTQANTDLIQVLKSFAPEK